MALSEGMFAATEKALILMVVEGGTTWMIGTRGQSVRLLCWEGEGCDVLADGERPRGLILTVRISRDNTLKPIPAKVDTRTVFNSTTPQ